MNASALVKRIMFFCAIIAAGAFVAMIIARASFRQERVALGFTFSQAYARFLGLDPHATFVRALTDLRPSVVRLGVDWDSVEAKQNDFDFRDVRWYVERAAEARVQVIIVVGRRTPRWPECHDPPWLSAVPYSERQQRVLNVISETMTALRGYKNISAWQVENEPLLDRFGLCPSGDLAFLKKEIELVRSLDSRPIILTDSGELSSWRGVSGLGDLFGSTLYRAVYSERLERPFVYWFVPPLFYRAKAWLNGIPIERFLISELQAEPWRTADGKEVFFGPERIITSTSYAADTGASAILLWGVEYWYKMAEIGNMAWIKSAQQVFTP